MAKMMQKWKKAVNSGSVNKNLNKPLLINEDDYLEPISKIENEIKIDANNGKLNANANANRSTLSSINDNTKSESKLFPFKFIVPGKKFGRAKVQKQPSADSNYFSDTDAHDYEEIDDDDNDEFSDNELLINVDNNNNKEKNSSKNNLYCELSHSTSQVCANANGINGVNKAKKDDVLCRFIESGYNKFRSHWFTYKDATTTKHNNSIIMEENHYSSLFSKNKIKLNPIVRPAKTKQDSLDSQLLSDDGFNDELNSPKTSSTYKKFKNDDNVSYTSRKYARDDLDCELSQRKDNGSGPSRSSLKRKIINTMNDYKLINRQNDANGQTSDKDKKTKFTCLTEIKPSSLFATQADGVVWYFGLLCDTMTYYINQNKELNAVEQRQRLNMINAHQLYAKNLYEVRIVGSKQLKSLLTDTHPCLIALACLLDSDAIRIADTHNCACDNYIYLFTTKIKFCSWKAKYFLALKKPKRSSMGRLSLIEELINCSKLIQDKALL